MWLDAAASSARPPAGIVGRTAVYGLFGGRLSVDTRAAGGLDAYVRGGRGDGPSPASWAEGAAAWEVGGANHRFAWAARASAFGLDYSEPFDYRALGGALQSRISANLDANVLTLRGDLRRGGWHLTGPTADTLAVDSLGSGVLALTGGSLTLGRMIGPAWIEAGAESYRGAYDGWFTGGLASASVSKGPLDFGLVARAWETPIGAELAVAGSASFSATEAATVRLELGRYATDPLYGTPGSLGASLGISVRLASVHGRSRPRPTVELGAAGPDGRRVRFRLRAPTAQTVALAGDFTDWRPRPMSRAGDDWLLELTIPTGVHHFAYLVNGQEWRVPGDAPGVTADEWGRKNATLVVDP